MKGIPRFSVIAGVFAAVVCSGALDAAAQQQPIIGCVKPGTGLLPDVRTHLIEGE